MDHLPKVVILGGGFAGLNVAKKLKKSPFEIILIDQKNHHLFQPLLYQVASATLSAADIATPLREIFSRQENLRVVMGTVTNISTKDRKITLENGEQLSYHFLVIATGARHSYFGHEEWEHLAPGLKTIQDALTIRERILLSFEEAEREKDLDQRKKLLNFVIIGAGPTGVEMAGAIAEISRKALFKNFRNIQPEKSNIYLIEGTPRVLPMYLSLIHI